MFMSVIKDWLKRKGITRPALRWPFLRNIVRDWFLKPYFTQEQRKMLLSTGDPVRYGVILLSLEQIWKNSIAGSLAECGVYKGSLSKVIHTMLPERRLFLFDTFQGFDPRDSDTQGDKRFADTSVRDVISCVGNDPNVIIRKGFFPETASGLEETFAFVMIDFDKYEPTLAALKVFYPLMNSGGFIFVHDYSSPESNWACSRALDEFLLDKPEKPILIPDAWGTALFRKL